MLPPDLSALADALESTVRAAGAAILEVYNSDFAVCHKGDASPVTAADAAGEAVILADLARLTPDIPVVAEEAMSAGHCPKIGDGPFWLVDPLDGTKEFIKRNGEFTVNIGLVQAGRPSLGLVYLPVGDVLYRGHGLGTAQRITPDTGREAIACRRPPGEGLVVLSSRSHATDAALAAFLKGVRVKETLAAGSSLKFCRVAEGVADLYPRFGPTCEWDTCAAQAVLEAAGGSVTTEDGGPFLYGKTPSFRNSVFIARGLPAL